MKQRFLALAAALCLAVGLAVPAAASSVQMTAEYFYTILNSATSAVNSVTASEDGTDVPTDQLWVTQAVLDEFQAKLDQAQAYYSVWVQAKQILADSTATALEKAVAQSQANEAEYAALDPGVRDYEPKTALVPGPTGLEHPRAVVEAAWHILRPGGLLLMEHGATQGEAVRALCPPERWQDVETGRDLAGLDRYLAAVHR